MSKNSNQPPQQKSVILSESAFSRTRAESEHYPPSLSSPLLQRSFTSSSPAALRRLSGAKSPPRQTSLSRPNSPPTAAELQQQQQQQPISLSRHNSSGTVDRLAANMSGGGGGGAGGDLNNSSSNTAATAVAATSVHPPIEDIDAIDKYITEDPSALVQVLPSIFSYIERTCLQYAAPASAAADVNAQVWTALKPLLTDLVAKSKAFALADAEARNKLLHRPPSPECQVKPYSFTNVHGEAWVDDYSWLNDRENQEVLDYIERENKYASACMTHTKPLQKLLYKEFVSRLDEGEESPKVTLQDGWSYYSKKVPGEEYRIHCRAKADGVEEVYLDENEMSNSKMFEDATFFKVGFLKHSPNFQHVAYSVDSSGNERYTTMFMDMDTKEVLEDRIEGVYEDFEFANDGLYVYYTLLDDCERAYQLKRHKLGTPVESDEILYHEEDEMFYLSLTKSCNGKFILLNSYAQITSETRYISADVSDDTLHLLFPRRDKIQYTCENHESHFYILTNEESKNNWLYRIPIPSTLPNGESLTMEQLIDLRETVIEHRDFVLIEDFQLRKNHLIVFERSNCLQNVRIVDLTEPGFTSYHYVSFSEMVYSLWPGSVNEEVADLTKATQFDTDILRYTYTSFVQPKQVVDYNMNTRTWTVVHEERVGGILPYDQSMYASKRLFATGIDGTAIPISIVYRRDLLGMNMNPPQSNPLLLHGYGAYGSFVNPIFSTNRLSLLDRGFVYAVAHVRGGADMGNGWYEEGKLWKKPNTFYDFISAAEYLCKEGYTEPEKLAIYGRSAGGLLIGAVINMRPDLFQAALTEVPFVDVINTMFDPTIPWTAFEYEEWGNPNDIDIYEVMKTYCPYSNIQGELLAKQQYPHLLVVGGMNDPRVAFFEPLKFVAKMRGEKRKWAKQIRETEEANKSQGDNTKSEYLRERMLLLRVDDVGHGGNSGQYYGLEDLAFEYSFLIHSLDAPTKPFYPGISNPSYSSHASPVSSPFSNNWTYNNNWGLTPQPGAFVDFDMGDDGEHSRYPTGSSEQSLSDTESNRNDRGTGTGGGGGGSKPKRRTKEDVEERRYRSKTKGDRSQNKIFQWVANFF